MMKHKQPLDSWDELPEDMIAYLKHYGRHFNKKMYEFAVSNMYKIEPGTNKKERIEPITKEQYNAILNRYNIEINNDVMYDGMYVMSMATADFLGSSLPNDRMVALFVKDYVDDVDQPDGFIFNRFYADCVLSGTPIEWYDLI